VPLFVISADAQDFGAPSAAEEHRLLWVELQGRWGELSDRFQLLIAEGSGHMVHHDRPAAVVQAVRSLLRDDPF
jgi:pimeloyl-ACP methyl ester carboxylesterase